MPPTPFVLVLVAGSNEPSNSNTLADAFIEGIRKRQGIEVEKIRLQELALQPFSLACYEETCALEPDYLRLRDSIRRSSAILIASPIWNFSVPAHLKNMIDRIGAFALDHETHSKGQLKGKPVGLIYTGGAPMIAWKALMYLTTLHVAEAFKYYDATIVYRHFEPKCTVGRGKFGLVVDKRPDSLATMRRDGDRFAHMATVFSQTGSLPASSRLWHTLFSFIYRVGNRILYPISKLQ